MYDLLLFDLDGTLTDPKEGITACVKYALSHFGTAENDEKKLLKFIGPPLVDSFRDFYSFSDDEANLAIKKYRERFSDIGIFENAVIDGAIELLKYLKENGKTIALATSKPLVFAKRITEKFGLDRYLDYQVGAELDGTRNYKDEVISSVIELAGINDLSKIVMIGDRKQDIIGAKKCGIASIGVRCGYAEKNELEEAGADYIFDNLEKTLDFFKNNT